MQHHTLFACNYLFWVFMLVWPEDDLKPEQIFSLLNDTVPCGCSGNALTLLCRKLALMEEVCALVCWHCNSTDADGSKTIFSFRPLKHSNEFESA